jgi:hypothetical protein
MSNTEKPNKLYNYFHASIEKKCKKKKKQKQKQNQMYETHLIRLIFTNMFNFLGLNP